MFGRGTSAMNTTIEVDGMIVNGLQANGQVQSYFNDFMNQEVSFQTSGIEAETSRGGIRINMIPAEGGNTFGGSAFIGGTHRNWQGNNIKGLMEEFGIEGQPGIDSIYDINVAQGGPDPSGHPVVLRLVPTVGRQPGSHGQLLSHRHHDRKHRTRWRDRPDPSRHR